jgi:hypothetical protein
VIRRVAACAALLLLASAGVASAQLVSVGPRFGLSVDPDQFVLGGQMYFDPDLATNLYFTPSAEVGFGDDVTLFQVNGDLVYVVRLATSLHPYFGAGVAVALIDFEGDLGSDTEVGLNLVGGLRFAREERASHFFVEGRFGVGDIPDLKVMAGWNFGT